MKNLLRLPVVLGLLLLCACSRQGECDNILQTHYQSWDRKVVQTTADTVFHSAEYPLDSSSYDNGIIREVGLYLTGPGEEENKNITQTPPTKINLVFTSTYKQLAFYNWQEDGLIGEFQFGGAERFQWIQAVNLSLPSLTKGTYAFGPADTADGLTVDYLGRLKGGPYNDVAFRPDSVEFSGYIRVEKTFTASAGKFSYYVKTKNKIGQTSVFSGTGDFQGFTHYENCSM
jgi:hypothetical protein